ncbi:phosphate transport system substrate-binding protein [Methylomarinovum caldicuralii]|uniref:Phosphate transport system substrate-binding protein n=1 Tax=Methylomarinovum caldicuralii TaxID=438856 RepID=A0AAU9CLZ3_9GAMM|nr:PstS family phosphate ABC transporter substrate-binding protein [Methylomarinovum caldicuralii]BCX80457.1 phosphate transport system substrate-binding protein [Methylomarinovum caldicuralii]
MRLLKTVTAAALGLLALQALAAGRDYIYVVGSSTVYPFTTTVAEHFGKATGFPTPKVESTGTGGGMKLFCAGVGVQHPDIEDASRRIKKSEFDRCQKNGVKDIVEVKIGYDGIVLAHSRRAPFKWDLTRRQIFLALAKQIPDPKQPGKLIPNPYQKWRQIDPSLPDIAIKVYGPPPTSGTRDAFVELAMEGGCKTFDWIKALKHEDKHRYKEICHGIREDGAYVEAGENDNLIVQKLEADPTTLGIFGYSFLDQNIDKIAGARVDGVEPTFENIAEGKYPVSRPLYIYVKKAHVGLIPGIPQFLDEYTSEKAWGDEGYLADKGLIPMPKEEREKYRKIARELIPLKSL